MKFPDFPQFSRPIFQMFPDIFLANIVHSHENTYYLRSILIFIDYYENFVYILQSSLFSNNSLILIEIILVAIPWLFKTDKIPYFPRFSEFSRKWLSWESHSPALFINTLAVVCTALAAARGPLYLCISQLVTYNYLHINSFPPNHNYSSAEMSDFWSLPSRNLPHKVTWLDSRNQAPKLLRKARLTDPRGSGTCQFYSYSVFYM